MEFIYACTCTLFRRIETYLPEQKKLWESSEEPVATKFNKQKLTELEEEQKVHMYNNNNIYMYNVHAY